MTQGKSWKQGDKRVPNLEAPREFPVQPWVCGGVEGERCMGSGVRAQGAVCGNWTFQ